MHVSHSGTIAVMHAYSFLIPLHLRHCLYCFLCEHHMSQTTSLDVHGTSPASLLLADRLYNSIIDVCPCSWDICIILTWHHFIYFPLFASALLRDCTPMNIHNAWHFVYFCLCWFSFSTSFKFLPYSFEIKSLGFKPQQPFLHRDCTFDGTKAGWRSNVCK